MKSIRWASAFTLAIALAFFGCGEDSSPPPDAAVGPLGTGGSVADSGGAVSDTGGAVSDAGGADSVASSLDSGVGDTVVLEGGIRDGGGDGSIPTGSDGAIATWPARMVGWMLAQDCWQMDPRARTAGWWIRPLLKVALTLTWLTLRFRRWRRLEPTVL